MSYRFKDYKIKTMHVKFQLQEVILAFVLR
ncbi:hypothetical protein UJ101_00539 [Flavobacteriaceae bacterium UJ101]|nr:hypothetical protein UJ101_00539 [Flavobacteriaceae bacterium UJ101]